MRQRIAGRLWQVVIDRGELFPALAAFKEFMLAGNGLFFQELYRHANTALSGKLKAQNYYKIKIKLYQSREDIDAAAAPPSFLPPSLPRRGGGERPHQYPL